METPTPFAVPGPWAELFRELDERPTLAAYAAAARRLAAVEGLRPVRVALLSGFTIQPLLPYLQVEAARRGFSVEPYVSAWADVTRELLDPESGCARHRPDAVFVLHLLDDVAPALAEGFLALDEEGVAAAVEQAAADLCAPVEDFLARSGALAGVHNFVQRRFPLLGLGESAAPASQTEALRRLNAALAARLAKRPGAYVIDFDRVCADVGYRRYRDEATWYAGRAPLASETLRALAEVQGAFLGAGLESPRKCLVLDLDNTLWGGVLGEDGLTGLELGEGYPGNAYRDFQRAVLDLHRQGVVLAINSKNNRREAEEALRDHPEMVLSQACFAASRINWLPKPENMVALAEELGIGLESLVFFDDQPAERDLMRRSLPEVLTLPVPADPAGYVDCLLGSRAFDKLSLTAEDRERGAMYRAQQKRRELRQDLASLDEYYAGLAMVAAIRPLDETSFERAASLLKKTSQFNLTTRRHSPAELGAFADDPAAAVFTLRLSDRFGSSGLVGLAIAVLEGREAVVDTFLLSCRVIGRTVETALLAYLADWARERGADKLVGLTAATPANEAFLGFYRDHGFHEEEGAGAVRRWRLKLAEATVSRPPYVRLEETAELTR